MFVYRSIVPTGIQCDDWFKCMFYILKDCYYRKFESVKEMLNDCCDKIRDYEWKINCFEAVLFSDASLILFCVSCVLGAERDS